MRRDRPQLFILLGMLVLTAVLAGAVLFETRWQGAGAKKTKSGPVPRVSLLPAGEGPFSAMDAAFVLMRPLDVARIGPAARFDQPLGSEHGAMSYNAQPFREDRHLGDDLNGIGGWDSDLGDPVYAIANGRVLFAGWPSDGWGNMLIVGHRLPDGRIVQSVSAHLDRIDVVVGDTVRRGQQVGTVGKGAGQYLAHLHFEIREALSINPGVGYADSPLDRVSPSGFLTENRGAPVELLSPAPVFRKAGSAGLDESLEINAQQGEPGSGGTGGAEGETVRELRQ